MNSIKTSAPSQDFGGYKNAYIIHIFILRLTENLMQAELFAIETLHLFLYWRRGLGKSVWGMENA